MVSTRALKKTPGFFYYAKQPIFNYTKKQQIETLKKKTNKIKTHEQIRIRIRRKPKRTRIRHKII